MVKSTAKNTKKKSNNKKYEEKQNALGLEKVTLWCPSYSVDELKELMEVIREFHLASGEDHRKLFPSMYREFSTGKMGNKSLGEIKKAGK